MATSTVRILFTANSAGALRSVNQLERGFTGLGRGAKVAGLALAGGLAVGLVAAAREAIAFEREMRNVNSIAKLSGVELNRLSKQTLALARSTGQGPQTLAKGLYDIVSSGFKANDAVKILGVSAKAASAGMTDTATSAKAVNAALNAYHLQATDARKVSDVLFQTVNKGVLTFEELAQNMGDLVPAAAPLGVSLEEVGAAIATITLQGVPAAEAATRVKNTMLQLASPSKALKKLLDDQGFASGEAAIKARGFAGVLELLNTATHGNVTATAALTPEIRSLLGVVGLTGKNLDTYLANLRSMNDAQQGAGATSRAFAEQAKSVGFQWQQAKAAMAAAAVPLGQVLFPLLREGASEVESFAGALEARLPQLRSQFGPLVGDVRDLAGALVDLGSSSGGQAALAGILTGLGGARAVTGVQSLVASVKTINPAVAAAGIAFGGLGAAIFADVTKVGALQAAFDRARSAAEEMRNAIDRNKDAHVELSAATTNVERTQLALTAATKRSAQATREYGATSVEAKQADIERESLTNDLTAAHLRRERAQNAVKDSDERATVATKNHALAAREARAATEARAQAMRTLEAGLSRVQAAGGLVDPILQKLNQKMADEAVRGYAQYIADDAKATDGLRISAGDAEAAVRILIERLGKVPTLKQVRIEIKTIQTLTKLETNRNTVPGRVQGKTAGGFITRASGGFVPLMPGSSTGSDSVPALLTPGEVVLNKTQMRAFGGPGVFKRMFGFTGGPASHFADGGLVQQFAGGGLVAYPASGYGMGAGTKAIGQRRSNVGMGAPKPKRARGYKRLSGVARKALAAVEAVNDRESLWERKYGQMQRGFDLTREEFIDIVSDDYGQEYEVLNQPQIDQRLGEIDKLVGQRHGMEKLIDEELDKLRTAIRDLEKAITELLAEIEREQEAARREQAEVQRLQKELGDNRREQRNNERAQARNAAEKERVSRLPEPKTKEGKAARKRYEYQLEDEGKRLDREHTRLTGEERTLEKGVTRHGNLREKHLDKARELGGTVGEFRQAKAEAAASLKGEVPLDRVDVGQEIQELQKEQADIREIRPAPRPMPPTDRLNAEADQLLTEMPADIDLALAMADLTDTRDDDRAALLRAQAFYTGNLGRGSLAAQASVARALKAVNDQLLSLDQPGAVTEETGGETPSVGGGTGGDGRGAADSAVEATLREVIAQLEKQLGLSRLAFAVQGAQQGVLGSFAKGTLHVPETGIYQLHAGEEVRSSARVSAAAGGGEGRPVYVSVILEGDEAGFSRYIRVKAVEAADEISGIIGRQASARIRGGRITKVYGGF